MSKVTLRTKPISQGRESLYLDFYPAIRHPDTGELTRREFLGVYVLAKPRTIAERDAKKKTLALAEAIRDQRALALLRGEAVIPSKKKEQACFVAYLRELTKTKSGTTATTWKSSTDYFTDFAGKSVRFTDLSETLINDFAEHLQTVISDRTKKPLSQNSARSYFSKIKEGLAHAYAKEYLKTDIAKKVEGIAEPQTNREFLELHELQALAQTPCPAMPDLQRATLFAALTGLRYCDISSLRWGNIRQRADGPVIEFTQRKTGGVELMPLADDALTVAGERGPADALLFPDLLYWRVARVFPEWLRSAGIDRHVTFHALRHTFAVIQLNSGTEFKLTGKLLGQKSLKATEVYAKYQDKAKREAVNRTKLSVINPETPTPI